MVNNNKKEDRIIWAATRSVLENGHKKNKRNGAVGIRYWDLFEKSLWAYVWLLKKTGLYNRGHKLALDVRLTEISLNYPELPEGFNNFKILHLTDLHLDTDIHTVDSIIHSIKNIKCDLCVMTGDFRMKTHGRYSQIIPLLKKLVKNIHADYGIYATLGNHDTYLMVREFEAMGINVLCNETVEIDKNKHKIILSGCDDVHYYFTDNAIQCLENSGDGFKIACVHSPELYDIAAGQMYRLYLCGHTHGGQICLPNGKPIFKHLYNGKKYVKGLWHFENMTGYTGQGCGTSGIPIRFYSQSEVAVFTLNKS